MGLDLTLTAKSYTDPNYEYDISYARKCWGLFYCFESLISEEELLPTDTSFTINFKTIDSLEAFVNEILPYKQQLLDCVDLLEKAEYSDWDSSEREAADHALFTLIDTFENQSFPLNEKLPSGDFFSECSLGDDWFIFTLYRWLNDISIFLYKYKQLPEKVQRNLYFTLAADF